MPFPLRHRPGFRPLVLAGATLCALASGCSSFNNASNQVVRAIAPYQVEVVQGNFVSAEQAALLKPGMDRNQVRDILGTPLLTSLFHDNRWDYVFTIRRSGTEPQVRRFTVYFKGDSLDRFDGADLPSEAEFVRTLDTRRKLGKVPELEASEEALQKFKASKPAAKTADEAPAAAPGFTTYPPLESAQQ